MKNRTPTIDKIPIFGIFVFLIIYIYSASRYPGGSQVDAMSKGFDWYQNYWCNLTDSFAINGEPNPVSSIAIFGLIILCLSIMIFFLRFSTTFIENKGWKQATITCAVSAMITAMFIFTSFHDTIIMISSIFGLQVLIAVIICVYSKLKRIYFWTGIICFTLLAINNYINYSNKLIEFLPLLQKVSLVCIFLWIISLNLKIIELNRK